MRDNTKIAAGHRLYVVCHRDRAYYVVGPFESYDTMRMWGDCERNSVDDPRWQSLELPESGAPMPEARAADWHPG